MPELLRHLPDTSPALAALTAPALSPHLLIAVGDADGTIVYASRRVHELLGYDADTLAGQAYAPLCASLADDGSRTTIHARLQAGEDWQGELALRGRQGRTLWVEATLFPLPQEGAQDTAHAGQRQRAQAERFVAIGSDITRLIELERKLGESERMFRSLTETIAAGIVLHRGHELLYANRAAAAITGYERAELLATRFGALVPAEHAEALEHYLHKLGCEGSSADTLEIRIRTRAGDTRWIELSGVLISHEGQPTGLSAAIDVTARKLAEMAHSRSEGVLKQVVQDNPVPTFVINDRHEVVLWNRALEAVTGVPMEAVVGTTGIGRVFYGTERPIMADLIVDGRTERLPALYRDKLLRSTITPTAYGAEAFFPQFGDAGRWLFFTAAPLTDDAGRIIGAIETLQDISERKQAEESLLQSQTKLETLVEHRTAQLARAKAELESDIERRQQYEQELLQRNAELEDLNARLRDTQEQLIQADKMASIGHLAAGVAHEINNPIGYVQSNLSSLQGYLDDVFGLLDAFGAALAHLPAEHPARRAAQALERAKDLAFLKDDIPALLAESNEGITRVRKIVADLKDFSRIDSNQEWEWADLHRGLDSTLNIVNNEIKYKADVRREYGALPEIECLPSQLNQVFMNLLVNAAHAIGEERGTITLGTGVADGRVWVSIADTGCGIPAEHVQRIFDPFFTTKPVGKGTGLGLSLSYGIVQKHRGCITVQSQPGRGTVFRIELPIQQTAAQP